MVGVFFKLHTGSHKLLMVILTTKTEQKVLLCETFVSVYSIYIDVFPELQYKMYILP